MQGIAVGAAAEQALGAIRAQKMQPYIGLQDPLYQLWNNILNHPEEGIQMLLDQLK